MCSADVVVEQKVVFLEVVFRRCVTRSMRIKCYVGAHNL